MIAFHMKRVKFFHFHPFKGAIMKPLFLFAILLLLSSCQAGKAGRLHLNSDVTASFEKCTVLPDYNYFYTGPQAQPDVILAVKKSYTFEKGLWKAIELDKKQLCDWMYIIDPAYRNIRDRYDGYNILSAEGKDVGLWYSREDRATIKEQDGKLIIYTPIDRRPPSHPFRNDMFY
jgi:hypothetical protein